MTVGDPCRSCKDDEVGRGPAASKLSQKPCGPRRKQPEEERHGDDNRRQREDRLVQALTDESTTRSVTAAAIPYVDGEGPSEPDHTKREHKPLIAHHRHHQPCTRRSDGDEAERE